MRVLEGSQFLVRIFLGESDPTGFITRHSHGHCSSGFVASVRWGNSNPRHCGIRDQQCHPD